MKIDSDIGELVLILDTGSTSTIVSEKLYPVETEKIFDCRGLLAFTSKRFSIRDRDFGPKNLYFMEIAKDLQEFDGVLGMDFIKDNVIYIDFTKSEIYIQ